MMIRDNFSVWRGDETTSLSNGFASVIIHNNQHDRIHCGFHDLAYIVLGALCKRLVSEGNQANNRAHERFHFRTPHGFDACPSLYPRMYPCWSPTFRP